MKRTGFLRSVESKIMAGYGLIGAASVIFMILVICCNTYVEYNYRQAINEVVSVNELETAVDNANAGVNMAYLFLDSSGFIEYTDAVTVLNEKLELVERAGEKRFVREVTDAVRTVQTYMTQSDLLMEQIRIFIYGSTKTGFDTLKEQYDELQKIYTYVSLRFQSAYSVELARLSTMEKRLNTLQNMLTILQLMILVAVLLFSLQYLARVVGGISGSIASLRAGVEQMQTDVMEAQPIVLHSDDEFDEFADAFNDMTAIIQKQMTELEETASIKEQLAEMEIQNLRMFGELQKSHLNFLQSRVNPHFLFNTLNMISSLARMENADTCAELMETTAAFLRYNLDNISKTVTLEQELKNLRDYVAIQEVRYGGRYRYTFDVEEDCLRCRMPCMVLQPLVENAIQHGLAMKLSDGEVRIHIHSAEGRLLLEVSDNGVGMTSQQISEIYEDFRQGQSSGSHIGIRNIYRRLKIYYQEDMTFVLENQDPGLMIRISLPGKETAAYETDDRHSG